MIPPPPAARQCRAVGIASVLNQMPDTNRIGNITNCTTGCALSGDGTMVATAKATAQQHSAPSTNVTATAASASGAMPMPNAAFPITSRTTAAVAASAVVASVCAAIRTCAGTGVARRRL
jgi:hypothetical protein